MIEAPSYAEAPIEQPKPKAAGVTIARNSAWLFVDSTVGLIAAFYCSVAVARGLGPDRMGDYNYIIWFASVLRTVTELAIPITFRKFASELMGQGQYSKLKTLVSRALRLQAKLAILGVAVGLVLVFLLTTRTTYLFAMLAVLSVLPALLRSIPAGAVQATENLRPNVISSLLGTMVNLCGITLSVLMNWGLLGVITSFLCSRVVDCIFCYAFFLREYKRLPGQVEDVPFDPALRQRIIRFARNQIVVIIFQVLLWERTEVFFLKFLSPARQISFFSLAVTLAQYTLLLPSVMANSAGATIMVQQGRGPREVARLAGTAVWFTMLVAAPTLFGMSAISGTLVTLIYGAKYVAAIPVLSALSLFALSQAMQYPVGPFLLATEQQGFIIKWASVMIVIDVVLCVVLIPRYGALGAVTARGAAHLVGAVGFLVFMNRRLNVPLPVGRMLKLLFICTVMTLSVRYVERVLPSLAGVLVGIPFGVTVFAVLARLLHCLDSADRDRLSRIDRLLPAIVRRPFQGFVQFLAPAS